MFRALYICIGMYAYVWRRVKPMTFISLNKRLWWEILAFHNLKSHHERTGAHSLLMWWNKILLLRLMTGDQCGKEENMITWQNTKRAQAASGHRGNDMHIQVCSAHARVRAHTHTHMRTHILKVISKIDHPEDTCQSIQKRRKCNNKNRGCYLGCFVYFVPFMTKKKQKNNFAVDSADLQMPLALQ